MTDRQKCAFPNCGETLRAWQHTACDDKYCGTVVCHPFVPTPDTPTDRTRGSKNAALLADFTAYCNEHPDLRFWQALRSWSDNDFILVAAGPLTVPPNMRDTFYSTQRNGRSHE